MRRLSQWSEPIIASRHRNYGIRAPRILAVLSFLGLALSCATPHPLAPEGEEDAGGDGGGGGGGVPEPPRVVVEPSLVALEAGGGQGLVATVLDDEGAVVDGASVTWSTSNASIVTVNDWGGVTAHGDGVATITARHGDDVGTAAFYVVSQRYLPFVSGFEATELDVGWVPEVCCSHAFQLVTEPRRGGTGSVRVEARFEDPVTAGGRGRAELTLERPRIPNDKPTNVGGIGDEVWYGFSVFVPSDWVDESAPDLIHQVKAQPDPGTTEPWKLPVFSIEIEGDEWILWNRHDANSVTHGYGTQERFEAGVVRKGVWTDWVVHARWSYGGDGRLEVWRADGQGWLRVVDRTGPTAFNDQRDFYFKIGLYKWPWNEGPTSVDRRVLYYDEVRLADGDAGFSEVSPSG